MNERAERVALVAAAVVALEAIAVLWAAAIAVGMWLSGGEIPTDQLFMRFGAAVDVFAGYAPLAVNVWQEPANGLEEYVLVVVCYLLAAATIAGIVYASRRYSITRVDQDVAGDQ